MVRIFIPQPPSVATPPNFPIEKFVPPFPSVGGSIMPAEHEMVPICSTLLPIAGIVSSRQFLISVFHSVT
jgi:hypothetical protein